jgi:hypothetical protein
MQDSESHFMWLQKWKKNEKLLETSMEFGVLSTAELFIEFNEDTSEYGDTSEHVNSRITY